MFFHFLFVGYLLLCIKYYFQTKEYSEKSNLVSLTSNETLPHTLLKDPYIIQRKPISYNKIFEDPQRYYIDDGAMIRLQDFHELDNVTIRNNKQLIHDLEIEPELQKIYNTMKHSFSCNYDSVASIIKGSFITTLKQNKYDRYVMGVLDGSCTLYLFHPKHKLDIQNKELEDIKKWAIHTDITNQQYVIIPIHWYYILEYNDECIHYTIKSDTVMSFWYPYITF
jgi:hypothetical protein